MSSNERQSPCQDRQAEIIQPEELKVHREGSKWAVTDKPRSGWEGTRSMSGSHDDLGPQAQWLFTRAAIGSVVLSRTDSPSRHPSAHASVSSWKLMAGFSSG